MPIESINIVGSKFKVNATNRECVGVAVLEESSQVRVMFNNGEGAELELSEITCLEPSTTATE